MVCKCLQEDRTLESLASNELASFHEAFASDFPATLELQRVIADHDVAGGTAPNQVLATLKATRARVEQLREAASAHA
jgi:argininosuccinate lyase